MKKITVKVPTSEIRKVSSQSIYHLANFLKSKGIDTDKEYRIWRSIKENTFEIRGYPIEKL